MVFATGTIDDGFVYADLYEVQFARDHARWLRVAFTEDRVVSGSEVEALARSLMPDDAANNCDFDPRVANEPDAFFFSCWSIWLSYQFDEAAWQGAPNGSLLVLYTPALASDHGAFAFSIQDGATPPQGKTILLSFLGAQGAPSALAPLPCYPFPEAAAFALGRAAAYGEWRARETAG